MVTRLPVFVLLLYPKGYTDMEICFLSVYKGGAGPSEFRRENKEPINNTAAYDNQYLEGRFKWG